MSLKVRVFESLENAKNNGYFQEDILDYDIVTQDLTSHDSDLENEDEQHLLPYVKEFFEGKQLNHVIQNDPHGCVAACVAMVTNNSYSTIRSQGHEGPYNTYDVFHLLAINGHYGIPLMYAELFNDTVNIITVPSLNLEGVNHSIVVTVGKDRFKVYDPNKGREGRKHYTESMLKGFSDVIQVFKCTVPLEKH